MLVHSENAIAKQAPHLYRRIDLYDANVIHSKHNQ